jgi:DMSO/TMAO reductase YedYZ molybdopterin-dependent catalytic subunit
MGKRRDRVRCCSLVHSRRTVNDGLRFAQKLLLERLVIAAMRSCWMEILKRFFPPRRPAPRRPAFFEPSIAVSGRARGIRISSAMPGRHGICVIGSPQSGPVSSKYLYLPLLGFPPPDMVMFRRDPKVPILLCTRMNGKQLPVPHGGPLRVIIPGYIGARSVKWLTTIRLRATPSQNFYMALDYKVLPVEATSETKADWMMRTPPLQRFGLQAVIATPTLGACLRSGTTTEVTGYAATGSGALISRVQVCAVRDEGNDVRNKAESSGKWRDAEREQDGVWSWCRWRTRINLPSPGAWALVCRAESAAGERQPKLTEW